MVNGLHHIIISVFVDDILISCADLLDVIKSVKLQIAKRYKAKDMGEMNWYLGMRYDRNASTGTITLNQNKYAQDILDRFSGY